VVKSGYEKGIGEEATELRNTLQCATECNKGISGSLKIHTCLSAIKLLADAERFSGI
jgi:hypothetical protein